MNNPNNQTTKFPLGGAKPLVAHSLHVQVYNPKYYGKAKISLITINCLIIYFFFADAIIYMLSTMINISKA